MIEDVKQLGLEGLYRGPRGWGMAPLRIAGAGDAAAEGLHLVSIRPGASRGNHAHGNATEWILVFGGTGKLTWRSPAVGTVRESVISGEGPVLYEIPPHVEHVITNTSGADIYALVFYNHPAPETVPSETLFGMEKGEKP
jgi:oxalate decarboxylase/phosphoglucose isomerase-like protein (cupin superfamily)